jgi:hypothetical protein
VVVCGADGIAGGMCKLQFDVLVGVPLLVKDRGCQPSESVSCLAASIAHPIKRQQDCVIAHRLLGIAVTGKEQFAVTSGSTPRATRLSWYAFGHKKNITLLFAADYGFS